MPVNPEYRPTPFMREHAFPYLFAMRAIGGKDLEFLAGHMYAAFGKFHRHNDLRAEALAKLPMQRMPIAPTFIYEHRGITRPLLESVPRGTRNTLIHTMFVLHDQAYREISFRNSAPVRLLLAGADRIHRTLKLPQEQFDMTYYLIKLTELAASVKGI